MPAVSDFRVPPCDRTSGIRPEWHLRLVNRVLAHHPYRVHQKSWHPVITKPVPGTAEETSDKELSRMELAGLEKAAPLRCSEYSSVSTWLIRMIRQLPRNS